MNYWKNNNAMKLRFVICVLMVSVVGHVLSNTLQNETKAPSATIEVCTASANVEGKNDKGDEIGSLSLAINTVNNILTGAEVLIGVLTLLTVFFGFFGYYRFKKRIDEKSKGIDSKLKEFEEMKTQLAEAYHLLEMQNGYISFANGYLYQTTEQMVNQISDADLAMEIFKKMNHNYHVANLYSADENTRFAAIAYLRDNGWLEDINHLYSLSKTDKVERLRTFASETIGIIKYRFKDEKEGTNN